MNQHDASLLKQISARMKTSSAVVPALIASLIAMPIGAAGLVLSEEHDVVFSIVLLSPLIVVLMQIIFFTFFDRDRLHNEEHIERRMQIDQNRTVIGDNRTGQEIEIRGEAVPSLEGPESQS